MAFKPPVAVYDSCVLYPFEVRNLLVQFAFDRHVEARWTDEIHDEWIRNLVANTPGLTRSRLEQTRDLMKQAVPSADVTGYQQHIPTITLPDPDDRHVVAAGIAGGASVIVTWNLKDFPATELSRHGLTAQSPDAFARDLLRGRADVGGGVGQECTDEPAEVQAVGRAISADPRTA